MQNFFTKTDNVDCDLQNYDRHSDIKQLHAVNNILHDNLEFLFPYISTVNLNKKFQTTSNVIERIYLEVAVFSFGDVSCLASTTGWCLLFYKGSPSSHSSFLGSVSTHFFFMGNNAAPSSTMVVTELLESADIHGMDCSARYPHLISAECPFMDILGRCLAARRGPLATIPEMRLTLQEEWVGIHPRLIDILELRMDRRSKSLCALRGHQISY